MFYIGIMQEELSAIENTIHEFLNLAKTQTPEFKPIKTGKILQEISLLAGNLACSVPINVIIEKHTHYQCSQTSHIRRTIFTSLSGITATGYRPGI
ncbi:MAG: hypothetical protein ACOX8W_06360 [bacterium]|jgi:hypothetical protein